MFLHFIQPLLCLGPLLFIVLPCNAKIKPIPLPQAIQNCYNHYAQTTLRDVVGENLCHYCEDRLLAAITPLKEITPIDPSAVPYLTGLVKEATSETKHGRVKRQALPRCRRREYRMLSDNEREEFHVAMNVLKRDTSVRPNRYDAIAAMHSGIIANSTHGGPNFLGWHRIFLTIMEQALRRVNPRVCIPYWDSSLDNELPDPRQSYVFSPDFLGGGRGNGAVTDGPFAGWRMPWGVPLIRNIGSGGQLFTLETVRNIMSQQRTSQIIAPNANLNNNLEFAHEGVHTYIGGQMALIPTAAFDPAFFLHHGYIDYLWETFRIRQRALGIDPQFDYPADAGSFLHNANADLGFDLNITTRQGFLNRVTDTYYYEPSPTCNQNRPNCGSRYLECNVQRRLCMPVTPRSRVRRAISNPEPVSMPPAPEPCMGDVMAIQNDFCVDGVCDIRNWVFVSINVVSVRPPRSNLYPSYPVVNGHIVDSFDIYQPSAYYDTERYSAPSNGAPRHYDKCPNGYGIGKVYVQSTGISYTGYYKESALVDQRLATSISIAYVAVQKPKHGPVKALFRAFDSCGRLCQPACRIPGTRQYKACSGAMEISNSHPKQYSSHYGQANANTWNFSPNADCPTLNDKDIPLTFYCNYKSSVPWTDGSAAQHRIHDVAPQHNVDPRVKACMVDHECTLDVPCAHMKCSVNGEMHRCRESCRRYAICTYGQFWKRTCPSGEVFNTTSMRCVPGTCPQHQSQNTQQRKQLTALKKFWSDHQRPGNQSRLNPGVDPLPDPQQAYSHPLNHLYRNLFGEDIVLNSPYNTPRPAF